MIATTSVEDFLADAGSTVAAGERLQDIGRIVELFGVTLAVGVLVFLVLVHRGSRTEVRTLLRTASVAGFVTAVGAVIELAGIATVRNLGILDAATSQAGAAAAMRVLGGLLIGIGLAPALQKAPAASDGEARQVVRWSPTRMSAVAFAGALVAIFSFAFDGHTVTKGVRVVIATVDVVHVAAGSVWFGGVVALAFLAIHRSRHAEEWSVAVLVIRFSTVATAALIAVALAGLGMTLAIIDGPRDLWSTSWGRLLLIKVFLVAVAAAFGAYNHFRVVPALQAEPDRRVINARARSTLMAEAVLLGGAVLVTAFLVAAAV